MGLVASVWEFDRHGIGILLAILSGGWMDIVENPWTPRKRTFHLIELVNLLCITCGWFVL